MESFKNHLILKVLIWTTIFILYAMHESYVIFWYLKITRLLVFWSRKTLLTEIVHVRSSSFCFCESIFWPKNRFSDVKRFCWKSSIIWECPSRDRIKIFQNKLSSKNDQDAPYHFTDIEFGWYRWKKKKISSDFRNILQWEKVYHRLSPQINNFWIRIHMMIQWNINFVSLLCNIMISLIFMKDKNRTSEMDNYFRVESDYFYRFAYFAKKQREQTTTRQLQLRTTKDVHSISIWNLTRSSDVRYITQFHTD